MSAFDLRFITVNAQLADISTADQVYIPVTKEMEGEVVQIGVAIDAAISGSDATITPKIGGTAMTNGAVTVAQSGSAAGDTATSAPTSANAVSEGDAIEIETDGASTGTAKAVITILIRR